jgi:hypothetical protein
MCHFPETPKNMIIKAEIIAQTYSGEYEERIYDNESAWNSQNWTSIKFTNEDYSEWCGIFRGASKDVAISEKAKSILVLTSDYLYQLNINNGDLIEIESQPTYRIITVAPNGEYILADYYNIVKIEKSIVEKSRIKSPIEMDMIEFSNWNGKVLNLTCEEFTNWTRKPEMELNSENWELKIKNGT